MSSKAKKSEMQKKRFQTVVFDDDLISYDDQIYVRVGREPYVCLDGREIFLEQWESDCANCGARFSFTRPANAQKFSPVRRCEVHADPCVKVRRRKRK